MMPGYYQTLTSILRSLDLAILEATAEMPAHLRWEQEQLSRTYQVVDTWREVQRQYCARNEQPDWQVVETLQALNVLLECKSKLAPLMDDAGLPEPDVTLGKMRR
jgi:hypothetical protein